MNETDGPDSVESYILSSKYRSKVLEQLVGTAQATPKEIANSVDLARPHVSRALSELREKDVVELRVPEAQTVSRYYGLTDKGERTWPDIKRQIRRVEWTIEDSSTPAMRSIIELAKDEFGDGLRCVGRYDGDEVTISYIDPDVRSNYSAEEFEEGLRTLIFDHSLDEIDMQNDECWSEVLNFTRFSVLRVRVMDGARVAISFDRNQTVSIPEFAESVISTFDTQP